VSTNFFNRGEKEVGYKILTGENAPLSFSDEVGDTFWIYRRPDYLVIEGIESGDGITLAKKEVKQLINYLQNWVDTGNFEGEKETENNDS
jgi:hypothetical protein